jgi:hypothetical protein
MNQYIEFGYETVNGQTLHIEGRTNGDEVKFIAYNVDHFPVAKSTLTTLDVRNIEEYILDNREPELEYYDLDYRDER